VSLCLGSQEEDQLHNSKAIWTLRELSGSFKFIPKLLSGSSRNVLSSALKIILLNLPLQFSDMETKAQRGEGTHAETQGTVV
jgi:hypothetical protein